MSNKIDILKGKNLNNPGIGSDDHFYPVTSMKAVYCDDNITDLDSWFGKTTSAEESLDSDGMSGGERGRIWNALRNIDGSAFKNEQQIADAVVAGGALELKMLSLGFRKDGGTDYSAGTGIVIDGNVISAKIASVSDYGVFMVGNGLSMNNGYLNVTARADWNETGSQNIGYIANKPMLSAVATTGSYNDLSSRPTRVSEFTNDANYLVAADIEGKLNAPESLGTAGYVLATYGNGQTYWREFSGGGGDEPADYADLTNLPKINNVTLIGSKTLSDIGIAAANHDHDTRYYTKAQVDSLVHLHDDITIKVNDDEEYYVPIDNDTIVMSANKMKVAGGIFAMIDHSHSDYALSSNLSTVATSGDYNDLVNKPNIPVIPVNISSFTNDAGYLTEHQDISGKVDKVLGKQLSTEDFTTALKTKLEGINGNNNAEYSEGIYGEHESAITGVTDRLDFSLSDTERTFTKVYLSDTYLDHNFTVSFPEISEKCNSDHEIIIVNDTTNIYSFSITSSTGVEIYVQSNSFVLEPNENITFTLCKCNNVIIIKNCFCYEII